VGDDWKALAAAADDNDSDAGSSCVCGRKSRNNNSQRAKKPLVANGVWSGAHLPVALC
jgi:hypothetical protein